MSSDSIRLEHARFATRCAALLLALGLLLVPLTAAAQAPQQPAPTALAQMAALKGVKASMTRTQSKIDSRLFLGMLHQRQDDRLALLTDFRFVKPEVDGRVPVEILVQSRAGVKAVADRLDSLGAVIRHTSLTHRTILARVALQDLEKLAQLASVRKIRPEIPAYTHAINVSEGDATHGADQARSIYGATGAGVKVCVLSDGVDSLATLQGSGDLPAVDVLPGQAGSGDEGSAMLEIIHDLAPAAELGFATALPTQDQFAQNILDLAADGCDIIVDDIIYLAESPFQDGIIAQAVNTVTASGVLYFSSAGNEGNVVDGTSGTWEGDFAASAAADPGPLAGANLHDFGDGGNSLLVEFGGGNPPILIWAEHYDLVTGLASTDYDLYLMNGTLTTIFDASTDVQDGTGGDDFPIEFIGGGTFAGERLLIDLFADGTTSSRPMFNLIVFRGEVDDALATNGTTRGHNSAVDAFSTAATPAALSFDGVTPDGPFPGLFTTANESESFTADGPRRVILDPTGAELTPGNRTSTGGVVRQKPDITAADGVATAAPGFDPFYGTSAAAPHAAAIAAMLKSAVPAATPAQIRTALVTTALDIEAAGFDVSTGAGIVMPEPALASLGAAPQAFLQAEPETLTQAAGDGDAFIEPFETWNLTIPLTNVGGAGATGISAVLSTSTPGVLVTSPASTYPDLAASASADNDTAYTISVGGAAACGGSVDLTLTITYTGGTSPQEADLSLRLGEGGTPVSFTYAGAVVPIADGGDLTGTAPGAVASADLPVAAFVGNVFDANLSIDGSVCDAGIGTTTVGLDHTFVSDLQVTLVSPGATSVLAINGTDGSGNNFCQTALDDESAGPSIQSVATGDAPFTGSFTPNQSFAAFDGEDPNGNWQLQVQDFFSGDTGSIRAFTLTLTPAICNAPAPMVDVSATKTASAGPFEIGDAVTYTVILTNAGTTAQPDNPGDEFVDTLPVGQLALLSASATSGTAVANLGANEVTWNGSLAAGGGSVTITIVAEILPGAAGATVSNQGTAFFDAEANGSNESSVVTDDPTVADSSADSTDIVIAAAPAIAEIPTASEVGLALLALLLLAAGWITLRRH